MASSFFRKRTVIKGGPRSSLNIVELSNMTPLKFEKDIYRDEAIVESNRLFKQHLRNQSQVKSIFFPNNKTDAVEGYQVYCITFKYVVVGSDGNKFEDYYNDNRKQWGTDLSNLITTDPWLNDHVQQTLSGQYPEHLNQLNVLLHMVDQLNPEEMEKTLHKLKEAFPDITEDFRQKGLPKLDPADIKNEIYNATTKYRVTHSGSGASVVDMYYYGEDVKSPFMLNTCDNYGFYNGNKIENVETITVNPCIII